MLKRFRISDGQYAGWMGKISTLTGLSGCSGAVVGQFSPGWCFGAYGDPEVPTNVGGLTYLTTEIKASDDGMIYAGMNGFRNAAISAHSSPNLNKYKSSGSFVGWRGRIGTVPTSGETGCTTTAVNSPTPGWCKGGTAAFGTDLGGMTSIRGMALDQDFIYYIDSAPGRFVRTVK